jgi:hypothetical protein
VRPIWQRLVGGLAGFLVLYQLLEGDTDRSLEKG